MIVLDFPNIKITNSKFGLKRNQAAFESEFSRLISLHSHAGGKTDRWEGIYTIAVLSMAEVRVFRSFITRLRGQTETFKAFNPDKKLPSTHVSGEVTGDNITVSADNTMITVDDDDFPASFDDDDEEISESDIDTKGDEDLEEELQGLGL